MNKRLSSIDLLRGVVMVLMAIDHVRVYSGISAGGPNPGIFFTRWITHFCVPAFVFFAGTGAWLQGSKTGDKAALSRFLLVRGALLVVLELTLIRFCWTFNLDYGNFTLAGVIWMLGWCMILLAAVIRLPVRAIGILGLGIIFLQQLFAYPSHWLPDAVRPLWEFIYPGGAEPWKGLSILYTLVPWIGVMAAGYAFGVVMQLEAGRRRRICLWIGLSATALFLIIGTILVFSHPAPEKALPPVLRLLNQTKYPASQLYLMMTLGPIIALLPWAERAKGWLVNILVFLFVSYPADPLQRAPGESDSHRVDAPGLVCDRALRLDPGTGPVAPGSPIPCMADRCNHFICCVPVVFAVQGRSSGKNVAKIHLISAPAPRG
jgi:uncharacterized membrane protein